jgi:hypothetical protein
MLYQFNWDDFLADLWKFFGMGLAALIPFIGAFVILVIILVVYTYDPAVDPGVILPYFVLGCILLAIILIIIILTVGWGVIPWGLNGLAAAVLVFISATKLWNWFVGLFAGIVVLSLLSLAIVGRKKVRWKFPRMCVTIGSRDICIVKGKEKSS